MNKLIVFDLDGVLIDSKNIHFDALNNALSQVDKKYIITKEEQKDIYEGLPTNIKLKLLNKNKGLPESAFKTIWTHKQSITNMMFDNIEKDLQLIDFFIKIKNNNINIAVASNSIKETIIKCLNKLGILDMVDHIVSNEDVKNPKPHPEMYWKAMSYFGVVSEQTVIFEDSIVGKTAAKDSRATLIEVLNRTDLTFNKIQQAINILNDNKLKWSDSNLNILIPMAGFGKRFADAGYAFPKPLVEVNGKPMIQSVVENINIDATYTYIVQKEHYDKYNLSYLLNLLTPNCNIIKVNKVTDGAAVTCLLAKNIIDNDKPLIIANSDQLIEWDSKDFMYRFMLENVDGAIITFESTHPKWSYVKTDQDGLIVEVAEKKPISNIATSGIYFWKHGSDYIKYAEQMIDKDIRTNGEFYVCPVFNEAIADGKRIYSYPIKKMQGLGTPEDLNHYLSNRNNND